MTPVRERPTSRRARGFSPARDLPAAIWLTATAVVVALQPVMAVPRWLLIHLLLLGAVSHSILVWSQYFTDALLHNPAGPERARRQTRRLALFNCGALAVMVGVLQGLWLVTAVAATVVGIAVIWHAVSLVRQARTALPSRFASTVRYYVAAATLLPVGVLLGTLLARGGDETTTARLLVAHVVVNLLGWIGLTVLGTLLTLWPTMLRTRIVSGAERAATRALPLLLLGIVVTLASALVGSLPGAALGLVLYLIGVVVLGLPIIATLRGKPATTFATWSVLAGLVWFVAGLVGLVVVSLASQTWVQLFDRLLWLTPALAFGFAGQVLLGALSYLLPVALRGGPSVVKATSRVMGRAGALRVVLVNGGLLIGIPPNPSPVRWLGVALALGGLAAFIILLGQATRMSRRVKTSDPPPSAPTPSGERTRAAAVAGLTAVALAVAVGVSVAPSGSLRGGGPSSDVVATGQTTEVVVRAHGMRFTPSTINVPAGNRLVITVHNTDPGTVHDLVLETGATTGRLAPGERGRVDAGVVGRSTSGWCSIIGHRQMGMTLRIVVTGTPVVATQDGSPIPSATGEDGAASRLDFAKDPQPGFTAHPAALAPARSAKVHRVTLTVKEVVREVAPGVTQRLWTYNGSMPGPTLHGRVGDVFDVTIVNRAEIGHSVDFHAGMVAPDEVMKTIPPGGSLRYRFTAVHAGIWMYHCSTEPMAAHIANGLFGAVVIDPPGLPSVAKQYVLIQSELYLGAQEGPVDVDKLDAERPDAVVFNGYANQYDSRQLAVRVGKRVRVWVLNAGPNRASSFHVVGGQFDTVYAEGGYLLRPGADKPNGSQALALAPAQGGFVELVFTDPGHYPFISHYMVDAQRGAHGILEVTR